jgi:hypothetical protein
VFGSFLIILEIFFLVRLILDAKVDLLGVTNNPHVLFSKFSLERFIPLKL